MDEGRAPPPADGGLVRRLRDPGFTPSMRQLDALVALLLDEDSSRDAERAIGRIGGAALEPLGKRLEGAEPRLRARILRVIGRLAGDGESARAAPYLVGALRDADAKSRRNAAMALGHVREAWVEAELVDAWTRDPRPEMRRTLAASLGKVGGSDAIRLLSSVIDSEDPELARIARRALMMAQRTESRSGAENTIDLCRPPPAPSAVILVVRRGLEDLTLDELSSARVVSDVRREGAGTLAATLVRAPQELFVARTMLGFRFPLDPVTVGEGENAPRAIARSVASPKAQALLSTWSLGPARYRIAWRNGAHRRALTWDTAAAISATVPNLVNDPTRSSWELLVDQEGARITIALRPRAADPRFPWRKADVPASSHPTIAAALARVAGVRADDVVWDPFVGSGLELIERARLGPYEQLLGSDLDEGALAAATRNLAAANVSADLRRTDALSAAPRGVTLILTNPPMGRRVERKPEIGRFLEDFLRHATRVLSPKGRLVWIAPHPERARAVALREGLALEWATRVDLGGFEAEIQRWVKS